MDWITSFLIAISLIAMVIVPFKVLDYIESRFGKKTVKIVWRVLIIIALTLVVHGIEITEAHTSTVTATVPATIWNGEMVGGLSTQVRVVIE